MNVSVNDTLTLTRLGNREKPSCIQSVVELCPARDRRPIKNASLQNELDSAAPPFRRSRSQCCYDAGADSSLTQSHVYLVPYVQ